MWSDARSDHQDPDRQTSGTAGCTAAAPEATAQSGFHRTPATARPEAAARAAPMAGLLTRRAHERWD